MAKKNQQGTKTATMKPASTPKGSLKSVSLSKNSGYLYSMSMSPRINEELHWFQFLPATFFTAFIIMIVRLHEYNRPMNQFFWTNSGNDLVEFFSYYKMLAIITCSVLALVILLYRVFSQSFFIKRSLYYIPMIIYSTFVIISYFMSDYKQFALWGWNDRFEGTMTLLAYMILLFYIINTVNNEKGTKYIIYPIVGSSILLSLLGLSQALGHDFFRTTLGKKLITPTWFWNQINSLTFNFENKEIYQTVYNINYVSFYLTLLIPLFGLLFIHSSMKGRNETLWKKVFWGILFGLNMYNLIGSQSSGGFLGMAIVVLVAIIILNKNIIKWWKPVSILLTITILVGGLTYERWVPELTDAANSVLGNENKINELKETNSKGHIDYIETKGDEIHLSYNGNEITFTTYPENPIAIKIVDASGQTIDFTPVEGDPSAFSLNDSRFNSFIIGPAKDSAGTNYFIIKIDDKEWPFTIIQGQDVQYRNDLGNLLPLKKVEAIGWENNQRFGSGRGYIWSRTLPLMKDTILIGHGADTYCAYFPQNDYVGKYNADWASLNLIIDKPHNMYMGAWIGTGGISVISLFILWIMYIIHSIRIFWNRKIDTFVEFTGLGIFLGICGFLVSGLVDDSSVSVMPMFYGLLGIGIAINFMLRNKLID